MEKMLGGPYASAAYVYRVNTFWRLPVVPSTTGVIILPIALQILLGVRHS